MIVRRSAVPPCSAPTMVGAMAAGGDSLEVLFARFRATGCPDSLSTIYRAVRPELTALALQLAPAGVEPDDLVQETFVLAMRHARAYLPGRPLRPWLRAILRNEARSGGRAARRRPRSSAALDGLPARGDAFEAALADLPATLAAAIARLPPHYRPVLERRLLRGESAAEIAQRLERPPATVRTQLLRGIALLRRQLPAGWRGVVLLVLLERGRAAPAPAPAADAVAVRAEVVRPVDASASRRVALRVATGVLAVVAIAMLGAQWRSAARVPDVPAALEVARQTARVAATPERGAADDPARHLVEARDKSPGAGRLRVRFADGRPVAGSRVHARPQSVANPFLHARWLTTDARGECALDGLPDGALELEAARGGLVRARVPGGSIELVIPAGDSIAGTVVDGAGAPVPGAAVWLSRPSSARLGTVVAVSDARGAFRLEHVSGERYLQAYDAALASARVHRVVCLGGRHHDVVLRLTAAGGSVRGRVRDRLGAGIAGARIEIGAGYRPPVADALGRRQPAWPARVVWTDARGVFEAAGVPAGRTMVSVSAPGRVGRTVAVDVDPGADTAFDLDLVEGVLAGTVADSRGRPLAGAWVGWWQPERDRAEIGVRTDAMGRYRLSGFSSPRVTVWVDGGVGGVRRRLFEWENGGAQTWNPVLGDGRARLHGRLLGPDGEGLASWRLVMRPAGVGGEPWPRQVTTDTAGRFDFGPTAAVAHHMVALPPAVDVPAGKPWTVHARAAEWCLALRAEDMPTAGMRVEVVGPAGRPVPGVAVSLTKQAWVPHPDLVVDHVWARRNSRSEHVAAGLPAGEYDVTIYVPGRDPVVRAARALAAGELTRLAPVVVTGVPAVATR